MQVVPGKRKDVNFKTSPFTSPEGEKKMNGCWLNSLAVGLLDRPAANPPDSNTTVPVLTDSNLTRL